MKEGKYAFKEEERKMTVENKNLKDDIEGEQCI